MKIILYENQTPVIVQGLEHLDKVISDATEEARHEKSLSFIYLVSDNENEMGFVVGSDETVLGFDSGSKDPPYFASKGENESEEPVMTCYLYFEHHTEFPRKYVIPFIDGLKAVHEFYLTGNLPKCVDWIKL